MKPSALDQAEAVSTLLKSTSTQGSFEAVTSVVAACANELLECGAYERAADLVAELSESIGTGKRTIAWVRASLARVRALLMLDRIPAAELDLASTGDLLSAEGDSHHEERMLLRTLQASCLWRTNRFSECLSQLEGIARDLVGKPDGPAASAWALERYGACLQYGDHKGAQEAALDAYVISRRVGDELRHAVATSYMAAVERRLCRWSAAREYLERSEAWMSAVGNTHFIRSCTNMRAIIEWKQGHLARSLELSTSVSIEADATNARSLRSSAELVRVTVLTHLGQFDLAAEGVERVHVLESTRPLGRMAILAMEYEGDLELERGLPGKAIKLYEAALARARVVTPTSDLVSELQRRVAECLLLLGLSKPSVHDLEAVVVNLCKTGERYEEAACYRVLAQAYALSGNLVGAAASFERGFDSYECLGTPFEHAKLWLAYGDWLAADSSESYRSLSGAREAFVAAIDYFERMGAEFRLAQARARLAALDETMRLEGAIYAPTHGKVRPARRPRHSADVLRRSQWVLDTFGLVTRSGPLLDMLHELSRVAVSDLPVLVLGESGTGKELVAKGVHLLSGRVGEFLAINCSAVPEAMLEGEFFGYMKGSFTNAVSDKPGLFEVAHEGTVFLDEIGEMSPDLQAKLLRFLETGTLRRVGATRDVRVDTRIVAATNRERAALQSGSGFRSDLYYRLAHAVYELPPLRARGDDVELLIEHFLGTFNRIAGKNARFGEAALARMLQYAWPGNVRELQAVVRKLVVAAGTDTVFTPRELPLIAETETRSDFIGETLANEKKRIQAALEQAHWVKTEAANILRISRTTLLSKMKRMGIEG